MKVHGIILNHKGEIIAHKIDNPTQEIKDPVAVSITYQPNGDLVICLYDSTKKSAEKRAKKIQELLEV